jgi:L-ascorbate metabolism protein UlaG (beta-lactamase superfamily)
MGPPGYPKHFDGSRFFNPGQPQARGWLEVLKWQLNSRKERSPRFVADVEPSRPPARVEPGELRVTFVNHATVLIQHPDFNILTDPVWSERASPVAWAGPRRHRAPGVRFEDLPRIDVVLLSHNHYDHLDIATVRRLASNSQTRFVVPTGVASLLRSNYIASDELDWGDSVDACNTRIHSVPAMHFSARGLFDRNRTLWCGYVIEAGGCVIYFAGDTGFGPHFAMIRERFGPPRLALLPIGAYDPRWFMGPVHMAPEDAVKAHEILGAKTSIAIHHGTFQLTDEAIDTPARVLRSCAPECFFALANGDFAALPI